MAAIGSKIFYGIVDNKPELPEGWQREGHFLLTESPDGKTWLVASNKIILWRMATWIDWIRTLPNYFKGFRPLKPGMVFADTREEAVLFSQLEKA